MDGRCVVLILFVYAFTGRDKVKQGVRRVMTSVKPMFYICLISVGPLKVAVPTCERVPSLFGRRPERDPLNLNRVLVADDFPTEPSF